MIEHPPTTQVDLREALYNDRRIGTFGEVQMPRECVTRLHGLVEDFDANVLKPNPWFPPATTPEAFAAGIEQVLQRHPVLRFAEVRDTGRWLHAITRFAEPVELHSAADQQRWTGIHRILKASVPSDPAAPALIALTRPIGSTNSKTGGAVKTLKEGTPISATMLQEWVEEVRRRPFETLGLILFGERRITPCPYCGKGNSHLDLGEIMGFCYGPCRRVHLKRLFEPFMAGEQVNGDVVAQMNESGSAGQSK
jgi:hypothetical protein